MVRKLIRGKWLDLGIAGYARNLNRVWQKKNELYLKAIQLLRSKKGPKISIDYREEVRLDR
jgi:hypothetical protein